MTGSDCSRLVSGPARQETNQDRTEDRAPQYYLSIIRRELFLPRIVSDLIERESGYFGQTDSTVHFLAAVTDWMRHILGEAGVLDHYRGREGGNTFIISKLEIFQPFYTLTDSDVLNCRRLIFKIVFN